MTFRLQVGLPAINLAMVCPECKAMVNYSDEKHVVWHTDRLRIKALAEAKAWVRAHPKFTLAEVIRQQTPSQVAVNPLTTDTRIDPAEIHYLICPVCAGRMYRGEDAQGEREETKNDQG